MCVLFEQSYYSSSSVNSDFRHHFLDIAFDLLKIIVHLVPHMLVYRFALTTCRPEINDKSLW